MSCIFLVTSFNEVEAKSRKHKNKSHHTRSKKRRRHHRGNGPDLKAITKDSAYTENPNNGVTPIETTGIAK